MDMDRIMKHWAKAGQVEERMIGADKWRGLRRDRGDAPSWDTDIYEYRIPLVYDGPFGNVHWRGNNMVFERTPKGRFVLADEHQAALDKIRILEKKIEVNLW